MIDANITYAPNGVIVICVHNTIYDTYYADNRCNTSLLHRFRLECCCFFILEWLLFTEIHPEKQKNAVCMEIILFLVSYL